AQYTSPAADMGSPTLSRLNVISYVGYSEGDGTEANPLTGYSYNQKQYYIADLSTMPPVYNLTQQVYIVKHADGTSYSKVQIKFLDSIASVKKGNSRIYEITYATIP
ncbi:MAG: hypothetical protein LBT13_10820, partial [Treponema sp.]|nr:hypothetical protein [Treponema sp.]